MLPFQLRLAQALTTLLFTVLLLRNLISTAPCQAANGLGTLSINGLSDISIEQSPGTNKYFNFTEIEVWEGWGFPLLILHLLFSHLPPARVSTLLRSRDSLPYEALCIGVGAGGGMQTTDLHLPRHMRMEEILKDLQGGRFLGLTWLTILMVGKSLTSNWN